jgi:hypothetical protein
MVILMACFVWRGKGWNTFETLFSIIGQKGSIQNGKKISKNCFLYRKQGTEVPLCAELRSGLKIKSTLLYTNVLNAGTGQVVLLYVRVQGVPGIDTRSILYLVPSIESI